MRKLKLSLLVIFVSIFVLGGVSQRHALACEFVGYSNYLEIEHKVFVSSSLTEDRAQKLLSILSLGKSRVDNTFGVMASSPIVIITSDEDEASRFGSNAYGRAHITPLGQCLVFGPKGHNVDVIAHEYTHSEVHYRVGWFNHSLNLPIWFNEGVSLLVDFREPYLVSNIKLSQVEVDAIKRKGSKFFSGDNLLENYQAARIAVDAVDKEHLYDNLAKIRNGENFNDVFGL